MDPAEPLLIIAGSHVATQLYLSEQNIIIANEINMILIISEVISIMVVAVGCKVQQDPTLVFRLGCHVYRGLVGSLHIRDIFKIKM